MLVFFRAMEILIEKPDAIPISIAITWAKNIKFPSSSDLPITK